MAFIRIPGTAQRYVDTATGENISRRQRDARTIGEKLQQREVRYRERKRERKERTAFVPRETLASNKRYWLQRYAEQYAVAAGISDREARQRALLPGSEFNRLWAAAEAQGFEGGPNSAWDALAWRSGAKGGAESADERSKYLAVIAWYMRNDDIGRERWIEKNSTGQFEWPGMPRDQVA